MTVIGSGGGKTVVDITCALCRRNHATGKIPWLSKVPQRSISTFLHRGPLKGNKRDFYKEENLPIFDYGRIHLEKKRMYVFGAAAHGGLGLDKLLRPTDDHQKKLFYMHKPVRHQFGDTHTVKDIAAGHGFTLISVKPQKENGSLVFGCGYNTKSQLGFQPDERDKPLGSLISIVPLPLPLDKTTRVLALGAGRGHSLISVEGKGLLALGENTQGQCGRRVIEDEEYLGSKYVCRIPPFGSGPEDDVIRIASRFDVSICLTQGGTVHTFGANDHGQLGRGKVVFKPWIPAQVEGDLKGQRIKTVATSGSSVLAVSDKGELFGWGSNDCGQVDPKELSNMYYEPVHIKLPRRIGKIIDVAIGDMFTLVLNEYGNVYVWGHGHSLGLGPKTVAVKIPTLLPPPLFGRNEFSPDVSVVKVIASFKYAAAVNSIGDMYTWGNNSNGCLGLGPIRGDYQFFPFKVALGGPVHKVCLGVDHAIIMTKAGF